MKNESARDEFAKNGVIAHVLRKLTARSIANGINAVAVSQDPLGRHDRIPDAVDPFGGEALSVSIDAPCAQAGFARGSVAPDRVN